MKSNTVSVLFDPSISSLNIGDHIISEAVQRGVSHVLDDSFVINVSTHLPISRMYMRHLKSADYKFVCGSNLLRGKMNRIFRQWDIRIDQIDLLKNSILIGVGWWQYGDEPNLYTKILYRQILSKKYKHSVRDSYTKQKLNEIGIENVLNTSCPTMWALTKEHCEQIPTKKSKSVVFTITDYNKNKEKDKVFIDLLISNYEKVYFFPQGIGDLSYLYSLNVDLSHIIKVKPSLSSFDDCLSQKDIEYIGTRLHGGIRALQHKRRSIIIGIDNRAIEKKNSFNLNVVERERAEILEELITNEFASEIKIPQNEIEEWKYQFR